MAEEIINEKEVKTEQEQIKEAVSSGGIKGGNQRGEEVKVPERGAPPTPGGSMPPLPPSSPESIGLPSTAGQGKPHTMEYSSANQKGDYSGMEPSMTTPPGVGTSPERVPAAVTPAVVPPTAAPSGPPEQVANPDAYQVEQPQMYSQPQQDLYAPGAQQDFGAYGSGGPDAYGGDSYGGGYSGMDPNQGYQGAMSSDIITEISEQVVEEKLSVMHDKLEKAISFRTIADAKMNNLDERLKRMEQIMDRLQLSLLQKVGEYVTDVKDIRTELNETQKSFKKLIPQLKGIMPEGRKNRHDRNASNIP